MRACPFYSNPDQLAAALVTYSTDFPRRRES
jgi:hypothetical protein